MSELLYEAVLSKPTNQQFDETFEFSGKIPESTTVTSHTVTITSSEGVDSTEDIKVASSQSGTVVTLTLKTPVTEGCYIVRVDAVSSNLYPFALVKLLNVFKPGVFI